MKNSFKLFSVILLSAIFLNCGSTVKSQDSEKFLVTKVVDGDTFWIKDGSPKGQKIRLIGVDAPDDLKNQRHI